MSLEHIGSKLLAGGMTAGLFLIWWPRHFPADGLEWLVLRGVLWTLLFEVLLIAYVPVEQRAAAWVGRRVRLPRPRLRISAPIAVALAGAALGIPVVLLAGAGPAPAPAAPQAEVVRDVVVRKPVVRREVVVRQVAAPAAEAPARVVRVPVEHRVTVVKRVPVPAPESAKAAPEHVARPAEPAPVRRDSGPATAPPPEPAVTTPADAPPAPAPDADAPAADSAQRSTRAS